NGPAGIQILVRALRSPAQTKAGALRSCQSDNERTHISLDVFYERTQLSKSETGKTRPKEGENEAGDFKGGLGAVRGEGLLCLDHESHFQKRRRVGTRVSHRETGIWPGGKLSRLSGAESYSERFRKGAAAGAVSKKGIATGERRTRRAQGSGDE